MENEENEAAHIIKSWTNGLRQYADPEFERSNAA
jgi:hypothetical protein